MDKIFHVYSPLTVEKSAKGKKKGLKIAGYANTTDKDRAGDIVTAQAWAKGVDYYRKNPVLLYQHDHSKPIGRVEKISVDRKGIFVEAYVSDAAEKLHGVQTLIEDGALKSFSVGFKVKDGRYDRASDTTMITDVELHEISVVSVPCNQESLFSVRKSFESNVEYDQFKKSLKEASDDEIKSMCGIYVGITNEMCDHYHTIEMDASGNGVTTYASHGQDHYHKITNYRMEPNQGHSHEIVFLVQPGATNGSQEAEDDEDERPMSPSEIAATRNPNYSSVVLYSETEENIMAKTKDITEDDIIKEVNLKDDSEEDLEEETSVSSNPYELIPFINLLSAETAQIKNGAYTKYEGKRYQVTKIATAQNPIFQFLEVDLNGKSLDNTVTISAENLSVANFWDIGSQYDLELTSTDFKSLTDSERSEIRDRFKKLVNTTEQELYAVKDKDTVKNSELLQEKLNKTLNLKTTPSSEWNDTNYHIANIMLKNIEKLKSIDCENGEETYKNLALLVNGHKTTKTIKEKETMATENIGEPIVLETEKKATTTETVVEKSEVSVVVGDNRAEKLVQKAGETVMREADEVERRGEVSRQTREELEELKSQISKYKNEIKAITESKNVYQEQSRNTSRFSEKQMANAFLLAKAMGRRDPFDTKLGNQIKAITSVDQFLQNFSTNIYEEMEQQLVIAPMFDRIQVDAKTFRVPVANEDTDDYVAQFASGSYATGIGDTTNVPTSNQHAISSVDFTPHKFMVTTHLAKDEEEDTILPLIDFLRRAATRRLSRSIDKAILRGTGALTGFTANPATSSTYASVVKGIIQMANQVATDGLTVRTADATTKASAANIASARAKMGKYGLQLGDHLVYLTTIEGYNELVTTSDFRTVDKFGPNATYLTGSVGAVYGIPVVITEFLDNVGSNSNSIGALVYKPGFMIAERRGIEIESEYEPRQQVTAMYMSTRFDFKALSTVGSGANVSTTYAYASTIRTLA
jgi:HK97 family phage prohead protease/HK97 family phage major capsid protein